MSRHFRNTTCQSSNTLCCKPVLKKFNVPFPAAAHTARTPATPPWVGSRSPAGWDQIPRWAGGWVLHQPPWSFGFDSQTRGTRENRAPPCVKVPGSSRVSAPPWVLSRSPAGWYQIPRWAGGWVLHQPPWSLGSFPKRGNRENRAPPCVKVPGSSRVPMGRLAHTGFGS
jgi:hypothetical protein